MISLTDFFDAASPSHSDVILLPAICRVHGNDCVPAGQCTVHVQQLNCCVKKRQTFLRPTCDLQTAQISVLWITRSGLSCSIVSTTDKLIVWMNLQSGSSMPGAVLNSRFLTSLLTSGKEDIEHVFVLKQDISSTARELTMLILSISVTVNMTLFDCYVFYYEIMPATLANTFLFILQGSALEYLRCGGRFTVHFVTVNSVCNTEIIIKIGQYLPKLCSDEKGSSFLTHSVLHISC